MSVKKLILKYQLIFQIEPKHMPFYKVFQFTTWVFLEHFYYICSCEYLNEFLLSLLYSHISISFPSRKAGMGKPYIISFHCVNSAE